MIKRMASFDDGGTGFSESDIHFARETFFRDCPNGYCSKRKFLAFIHKSSANISSQKPIRSYPFLQALITRQNYRQSRKFFSMMFDIYDRNHDGQLDFNEYIYALSALSGANRLRMIETLYNFFDSNNQGYITRHEFNSRKKLAAQFLGQNKIGINDNLSYEQAFNTMDTDKDGRISKEEFIQWHLEDCAISDERKPMRKRTRLLKNLTYLVDIRGQVKTTSLGQQQQEDNNKSAIDAWLETTINVNNNYSFPLLPNPSTSIHTDRHLLKVLRRARNRFIQHKHSSHNGRGNSKTTVVDNQSDSGQFTASSRTNFNDDIESNSLLDIDEDYLQSIPSDNPDNELLCQSLEAALMKTLLQLRQLSCSSRYTNTSSMDEDQSIITRL